MEITPYSNRQSVDKIWFVCRARGDSPVKRAIERLDTRTRAATEQLFSQTEGSGPSHRREHFRHLGGDVFEFKVHQAVPMRYVAFRCGLGWVITFAVRKPGGATLQHLIRETQWLHDEYERTQP